MKQIVFLALTLLLWSAVSLNAQVNIGSLDDPHTGAVLDLSQGSTASGLLLPHVSITNVKSFQLPTGGNSTIANAIGMVVYNTNPALGEGLYTWNGTEWKSVGSGSSGNCTPVTATSSSSKTGSNTTLKVEVSAGTPAFTYTWYKSGVNGSIRTVSNATATSDTYTTAAAGTYTCQVVNTCTTTPASFTFIIGTDGNSDSYVDNGNGTYTDNDGNLVVIGEDGTKEVYTKVDSDIPGIYLDKDGEIVYTGADGIPGTADDDTFIPVTDRPIPKQEIRFSFLKPVELVLDHNTTHQIVLDFADGEGSYTGKVKYISTKPSAISVSSTGLLTANEVDNTMAASDARIYAILEDGSFASQGYSSRPSTYENGNYTLIKEIVAGDKDVFINSTNKLGVTITSNNNNGNVYRRKSITYEMANAGGTGSTVTEGGWLKAGATQGTVTVSITVVDFDDKIFSTNMTIHVFGAPSAETSYDPASTNWATLEAAPEYAGGTGTESDPYLISSVRQLKKLSVDISIIGSVETTYQKYFKLTTDLDFSADNTVKTSLIGGFNGSFDGNGKVIKELHVKSNNDNLAIFSSISYGEVKNLGRDGGSIEGTGGGASGITCGLSRSKMTNCYNSATISVRNGVGGLVAGRAVASIIENCYNIGEITVTANVTGGLIMSVGPLSDAGSTVIIKNSYNFGQVTGTGYVSTLIGNIYQSAGQEQTIDMNNCYNFGDLVVGTSLLTGSIIGVSQESDPAFVKVIATNVYTKPNSVIANGTPTNRLIGWINQIQKENLVDGFLSDNPTLKEDAKYTTEYSQSAAFATELGSAFKFANGRPPKLAWEQ